MCAPRTQRASPDGGFAGEPIRYPARVGVWVFAIAVAIQSTFGVSFQSKVFIRYTYVQTL